LKHDIGELIDGVATITLKM